LISPRYCQIGGSPVWIRGGIFIEIIAIISINLQHLRQILQVVPHLRRTRSVQNLSLHVTLKNLLDFKVLSIFNLFSPCIYLDYIIHLELRTHCTLDLSLIVGFELGRSVLRGHIKPLHLANVSTVRLNDFKFLNFLRVNLLFCFLMIIFFCQLIQHILFQRLIFYWVTVHKRFFIVWYRVANCLLLFRWTALTHAFVPHFYYYLYYYF
jgi:hypothetical protein